MNFGTTAAVWLTATAVESTTTGDAGTTLPLSIDYETSVSDDRRQHPVRSNSDE